MVIVFIYCFLKEENREILKFYFIYLFIYLLTLFTVEESSSCYISKAKNE